MGYETYGITRDLVDRIKRKMKNPVVKDRVKGILEGVTYQDLQDRTKVTRFVGRVARTLGEKLTDSETGAVVNFVLAQKIDPNNTFHLIKLWGMFR
jgi:uncharacterized protein YpuA (DUF1002 family)